MAASSKFPAIVSLEYERNGSVLPAMKSDIDSAFSAAGRRAEDLARRFGASLQNATGDAIKAQLDTAVGRGRTSVGSLDVDVPGMRAAVAAQEARVAASLDLARAYTTVGRSAGEMTAQTMRAATAADNLSAEESENLNVMRARLAVAEELQRVLNQQTSATGRFVAANDNVTTSAGQQRMALQQLSFQLSDVTTMYALGARPAQIFASQAGQVTQALGLLGGSAGRIGAFFGGPWGLALTSATVVLAPFVAKLFEGEEALKATEFASYGLSDAQSILAGVMDKTTGRITAQSGALIALARAQALAGQIGARRQMAEARDSMGDMSSGFLSRMGVSGQRGLLGQGGVEGDILETFMEGSMSATEAERGLRSLQRSGMITEDVYLNAAKALTDFAVAAENLKTFEGAERMLAGQGTAADRAMFIDPKKTRSGGRKGTDEAKKLAQLSESAAEKIQRLNEQFDQAPRLVDRVNQATRELDSIITDLSAKDPIKFRDLIDQAKAAKVVVQDALQKPFNDVMEAAAETARIEQLLIAGKAEEAEIQQRIHALVKDQGQVLPAQEAAIRNIVAQERARARLLEIQADTRQRELRYLDDTRDNLRQTTYELLSGKGLGSIGNFFQRQFDSVIAEMADSITSSLFDDFFQGEKDRILGFDKIKAASEATAQTSNIAADALRDLANAAKSATSALNGTAANDNGNLEAEFDAAFSKTSDIVVVGQKDTGKVLKDSIKGLGKSIFGEETFTKLSSALKTGMQGAAIGQATSGLARSLGLKQSNTGAQIGGALGNFIKFIPGLPPGVGSMIGGLLGGTVGGLLKKTKSGAANITGADSFSTYGNSGSFKKAASGAAGSVQDGLRSIAEQLGGDVGSFNVTIGQRHGDWRVRTGTGSLKTKKGAKEFDDDAEGAIAYAISLAIEQGAITGLKAATQRLIQGGDDIEAQLAKAVKFQSVFDELDQLKDPVGAAVKTLNREFEGLVKIFAEAGASAEEYAKLEELYGIKRAEAVEQANERVIGSLKSLYDQLTVGNDARSLTERLDMAKANYDPLAARVAAGDTTAFDAYAEAAQALEQISRELYGSQTGYFTALDNITALTKSALDSQSALAAAGTSTGSPFASGGSGSASGAQSQQIGSWSAYLNANPDVLAEYNKNVSKKQFSTAEAYAQWHYQNYGQAEGRNFASADSTPVVSAIDQQTMALINGLGKPLDSVNAALQVLIRQGVVPTNYYANLGVGGNW